MGANGSCLADEFGLYGLFDETTREPGYGPILYNTACKKGTVFELEDLTKGGYKNMVHVFEKAANKYPERNCTGIRRLIKIHDIEENGKTFQKMELENHLEWITYQQYYDRVVNLSKGIKTFSNCSSQDTCIIYAETQQDWMTSAYAAWAQNLQVVTVYATLGAEGAQFAINQTAAKLIFVDGKLLGNLAKVVKNCPCVKNVVVLGAPMAISQAKIEEVKTCDVNVLTFDEAVNVGKLHTDVKLLEPSFDDIAFVMYTSGTTGNPKGVRLSHGNVVGAIIATQNWLEKFGIQDDEVYLAYLPLAHIMEVVSENAIFSLGLSVGFGNPHTLTASGVKLKVPESEGDCVVIKPSIAVFAPAVMEKIYATITRRVEEGGALGQFFFGQALAAGKQRHSYGTGAGPILNTLVGKKIQASMGGNLQHIISGSAALSSDVHCFVQTLFNCPVRQGYGLTETCALSTAQDPNDWTMGVGVPSIGSCIRLADWEEGGYATADEKNPGIGMQRGEVLVSGHCVSPGYFIDQSNPDPEMVQLNEESFITMNGMKWFRTGDIGQITPTGALQIIDRKKDLWKGPNGEYVAFQKVEGILKLVKTVDQAMCFAKPGWDSHIALLNCNKKALEGLAKEQGVEGTPEEIAQDTKIRSHIQGLVKSICQEHKLQAFEIPSKIAIIVDPWTPDNELLTAANKMKRPIIAKHHETDIEFARTGTIPGRV